MGQTTSYNQYKAVSRNFSVYFDFVKWGKRGAGFPERKAGPQPHPPCLLKALHPRRWAGHSPISHNVWLENVNFTLLWSLCLILWLPSTVLNCFMQGNLQKVSMIDKRVPHFLLLWGCKLTQAWDLYLLNTGHYPPQKFDMGISQRSEAAGH